MVFGSIILKENVYLKLYVAKFGNIVLNIKMCYNMMNKIRQKEFIYGS